MMSKLSRFALLTPALMVLASCAEDSTWMHHQQCNNMRYEITQRQYHPQLAQASSADSQYQRMQHQYQDMDCQGVSESVLSSITDKSKH